MSLIYRIKVCYFLLMVWML